jgi:hypothetical protein
MTEDRILTGPPLEGSEILARLERRMGSMKLVGERDDLLLDAAVFIAMAGQYRAETERLRAAVEAMRDKYDKRSRDPAWDRQDQDRASIVEGELRRVLALDHHETRTR